MPPSTGVKRGPRGGEGDGLHLQKLSPLRRPQLSSRNTASSQPAYHTDEHDERVSALLSLLLKKASSPAIVAEAQVELAIRPGGRPRKACKTCRMGKRRCTHAVEGLEESGLVARASGLSQDPRNGAAEENEVNVNDATRASGPSSPSLSSSPSPHSSPWHASSSAPAPPSAENTAITMAKKKTSKRGMRRTPKGANTTNAGADEIPSTTTTNAGVDEAPSNTTITPAAPATSGPNTAATTKKSAPKKQRLTIKMPATTTDRPSTAISRANIPDFPEDDNLRGSMTISCHKVFSGALKKRLDEFEVRFKAMLEAEGPKPAMSKAWEDVCETADDIQWTVDQWVAKWAAGN